MHIYLYIYVYALVLLFFTPLAIFIPLAKMTPRELCVRSRNMVPLSKKGTK